MYKKRELIVTGVVQGIGFRPFCVRLAREIGLSGTVSNTSIGVRIELAGTEKQLDLYESRLLTDAPPLANIQNISRCGTDENVEKPAGEFIIGPSKSESENTVLIPPDIAVCEDCLRELRDPGDRRFRYPFINCTNCGPRYSIVRELPYDRPKTTMAEFSMCALCEKEYKDPGDRRFHAQPVACPECGPHVWLVDGRNAEVLAEKDEAVSLAVNHLLEGRIIAIKGLGGFHIACLPEDEPVALLRERKKRPHKPFALMVRDMETAKDVVYASFVAEQMMRSPRCPIVICPKKEMSPVSGFLAPGQNTLGVMLPYTPLHHLIMERIPMLVMTSANFSESPILATNEEALRTLANIVDYLLLHDRKIQNRIDDSVVTFAGKRQILLRRARGFVPHPVVAAGKLPPMLACGPEMKSTFALSIGKSVIASQYLGDLKRLETTLYYEKTLRHFLELFRFTPRLIVKDMHPQYVSGYIADKVLGEGIETLKVQHHHAHMASCLLEKGVDGPVIGLILDGTGYGTDGSIWGGEILFGDSRSFERVGHLRGAFLPGGEKSITEPWRYALSLLIETFGKAEGVEKALSLWPAYEAIIPAVAESTKDSPVTSSCGRLFDAVAALTGVKSRVSYDGQAAMELEACAEGAGKKKVPFAVIHERSALVIDWRPAVSWILENLKKLGPREIAAAFHAGLAEALAEACLKVSRDYGVQKVVLSGGVWQNRRLLSLSVAALRAKKLEPLWHSSLAPNDEAVSVGQIAVGAAYLKG